MGIISGSGSFRGRFGDHFRVGDHFGVGIISGAVQRSMKLKIDRPNTTPTVPAICEFDVYFSVFQPFLSLHSCLRGVFRIVIRRKIREVKSCCGKV